jgi:hypothetical protein
MIGVDRIAVAPDRDERGRDAEISGEFARRRPFVDDIGEGLHAEDIASRNHLGQRKKSRNAISSALMALRHGITHCNMDETPADRLKTARIARGFRTARQFSDTYGIPQPSFSMHESGKRGLTSKAARQYADLLDVSIDWLLTGKGDGPSSQPATTEDTKSESPVSIHPAIVKAMETGTEEQKEMLIALSQSIVEKASLRNSRDPKKTKA